MSQEFNANERQTIILCKGEDRPWMLIGRESYIHDFVAGHNSDGETKMISVTEWDPIATTTELHQMTARKMLNLLLEMDEASERRNIADFMKWARALCELMDGQKSFSRLLEGMMMTAFKKGQETPHLELQSS